MLWPYLKILDWDLIFGRAVKAISSPGVRSPWQVSSKAARAVRFVNFWKINMAITFLAPIHNSIS